MTFVAVKPPLFARNTKLSLKMDFRYGSFKSDLEAESFVDCIEQFLGGKAVLDFKSVGHMVQYSKKFDQENSPPARLQPAVLHVEAAVGGGGELFVVSDDDERGLAFLA